MDETTLEKPKSRIDRPASHDPAAPSFWHTLRTAFFSWARHTFSVSSLVNGLKSLLWVAPLSVIIWIYADREVSPAPQGVYLPITVRSSDPTRVVRLVDLPDGKVRAELSGSNAAVGNVLGQIESGAVSVQLDIPENVLLTSGNHSIASAQINSLPLFKDNGINVSDVQPTDLTVNVDVLQENDVDVQPAPDGKNYVSPPIFEPRKVHVRAPASVFQSGIVVYAHLDEAKEAVEATTPGPHDLTLIPVSLAKPEDNVTITPRVVSAHVEIKKSDVTGKIDSIPIWAIYPPTVDDKVKAVYDQSLPSVIVTGPDDQIQALTSHTSKPSPKATFEVDALDTTIGVDHQAKLTFELPPGVQVSPEFAQKTITYRLVDRKSSD